MTTMPSAPMPATRTVNSGLAIAALVLGILSFCLPVLGLVAIVLGAMALIKAGASPETHGGKGLAIGGIVAAVLSMIIVPTLALVILLPSLGKARAAAREMATHMQLSAIGAALGTYAVNNKGWYPESVTGWQDRLSQHGLDADFLRSPRAPEGATDSYIYVPGLQSSGSPKRILAYENPAYVQEGKVAVLYLDGRVESMDVADLNRILESAGRAPKPPDAGSNTP